MLIHRGAFESYDTTITVLERVANNLQSRLDTPRLEDSLGLLQNKLVPEVKQMAQHITESHQHIFKEKNIITRLAEVADRLAKVSNEPRHKKPGRDLLRHERSMLVALTRAEKQVQQLLDTMHHLIAKLEAHNKPDEAGSNRVPITHKDIDLYLGAVRGMRSEIGEVENLSLRMANDLQNAVQIVEGVLQEMRGVDDEMKTFLPNLLSWFNGSSPVH